jgi:hypothetical protein
MKQVVSNYSYSPATNVLTLSGVNIDQDQLLLVVAPGVGRTMYNFASGVTGVVSAGVNTRVTLNASTASLTTTSPLVIYYDDQLTNNTVTISSLPVISGTVTANTRSYGLENDPWVYIPRLTMSHPDVGNIILDGYYRFDGVNTWGIPGINQNYAYLLRIDDRFGNDQWVFKLNLHDETNDQEIELANYSGSSPDFPTIMYQSAGTLVSGSLTFNTEQRESYGVRVTNSVTISNSVTIGSLPVQLSTTTIGGTARLNVTLSSATTIGATAPSYGNLYGGSDGTNLRAISVDTSGRTVVTGSVSVANTVPVSGTFWQATQPVSGTVTANVSGTVPVSGTFWQATQPVSGTVTANISGTVPVSISSVTIGNTVTVAGTVTANVASTTVTISAQPSGALTTRFGSVVTANTAGITTAVTNTSRKYLLAQNISTGTVTIGIGFSPTTTQGIQLTAGAGLTFDSFVPTGAVYWLGATTGAAYTILEG